MEANSGAGITGFHMTWVKQGRIIWLASSVLYPEDSNHMQVPTPYIMEDRIRVFYASRNKGKAFVAYFDLSKDFTTVFKAHREPVFEHGKHGMFDSDGVMPSCIIENNGDLWMYYIGWSELKNTARYQNEIGIAVSKDGGDTFERMFSGPIIGRSQNEPGLAVMPFVIKDDDVFRMWYQSGTGWHLVDGKYEPTYVIKYAESENGIDWNRSNTDTIPCNGYQAVSRPSIIKDDGWKMWYCHRASEDYRGGKGSYRLGYAEAHIDDYEIFTRKNDKAVMDLGEVGEWDSEMICYPYIIELDGKRVMLYNGNEFGQTGIGVAIWTN